MLDVVSAIDGDKALFDCKGGPCALRPIQRCGAGLGDSGHLRRSCRDDERAAAHGGGAGTGKLQDLTSRVNRESRASFDSQVVKWLDERGGRRSPKPAA